MPAPHPRARPRRPSRRRIPVSVIRGGLVAVALVMILAGFGSLALHLGMGLDPIPAPTVGP